jgi:hypothetical protein
MPNLQVNTDIALATLVDLENTLKKTVVVSAAAVLSRMTNDLKANAAAAVTHLDAMGRKLDGLRNDVSQRNGVSFTTKLKGKILEVDSGLFAERVGIVDDRIDGYKDALFNVIESDQREGLEFFCHRVGALGRAIQDVVVLFTDKELTGSPLYFDQFFMDTMGELSKKDWNTPNEDVP